MLHYLPRSYWALLRQAAYFPRSGLAFGSCARISYGKIDSDRYSVVVEVLLYCAYSCLWITRKNNLLTLVYEGSYLLVAVDGLHMQSPSCVVLGGMYGNS